MFQFLKVLFLTAALPFLAAAATPEPAPVSPDAAASSASANEAVAVTLRQNIPTLSRCYLIVSREHASAVVRVSVSFEIAPDGHVPTAKVIKNDHKDGLFESCIVDAFRSWPFPAPPGGAEMKVTYPILFSSSKSVTIPPDDGSKPSKKRHAKAPDANS